VGSIQVYELHTFVSVLSSKAQGGEMRIWTEVEPAQAMATGD
jgi:hypothetical protein